MGSNLDGLTKSSKFQPFQVQLLVTAMSNQIFGENTMILLALRLVKKFHYLDLTYPGVCWVCCSVQSQSSAGLFNYNASRSIVWEHLFDKTLNALCLQTVLITKSSV